MHVSNFARTSAIAFTEKRACISRSLWPSSPGFAGALPTSYY
jgi:hypothetical protein